MLPEDHRNPFEGQHRQPAPPSKSGWLPYEIEELTKLVERPEPRPKRHTWATARPWIILVALFSGMRLGWWLVKKLGPKQVKGANRTIIAESPMI